MVGTLLITCVILSAIYTFLTSQVCFFPCPTPPPSLGRDYNTVFHVPTYVSAEGQSALRKRKHSSSTAAPTALMLRHTQERTAMSASTYTHGDIHTAVIRQLRRCKCPFI